MNLPLVLRNRLLIRDGLSAPLGNGGYNVARPMIGELFPDDPLGFGHEVAGHEFQGVLGIRCKIPVQLYGIFSLQQNVGLPLLLA